MRVMIIDCTFQQQGYQQMLTLDSYVYIYIYIYRGKTRNAALSLIVFIVAPWQERPEMQPFPRFMVVHGGNTRNEAIS